MLYNVKYLEPTDNGDENEIEAQLEVADTEEGEDLTLLLTKFAEEVCGKDGLKVTAISAVMEDEPEEGLDNLENMVKDKIEK